MSETNFGIYQQKDSDGNYVQTAFGLGFWTLEPDGHTVNNLITGDSYDLSNIGSGGGTSVAVADNGTTILSEASELNFGDGLAADDAGSGTADLSVLPAEISHNNLAGISAGDHRSAEQVEDLVAGRLSGVGNISVTHDDANDTIEIDTSALNEEEVQDAVDALLLQGNGINLSYDDANDNLTIAVAQDGVTKRELDTATDPTWTAEHSFEGGITALPEPTSKNDAVRKQYADALEQGLSLKDPVAAATDGASVDLSSTTDPNPIDGVTLADGERVLLKDQTDGTENGIYVASTATDPTTWSRAPDADSDSEVTEGIMTFVEGGSANKHSSWVQTTESPTLGTDALNWVVFGRAGEIEAGDYASKSGQTINVEPQQISPNNLDGVDWAAMGEGADSDKPSAGEAGRYYFATDKDILYRDNGTSWTVVGGVGTADNPIPDAHFGSISTGEAVTNNETFVRGTRSTSTSSTDSGTFVKVFDGDSKDVRGEFSNGRFTPDKSGEYFITFIADMRGNTAAGDNITGIIADVDGGNTVKQAQQDASKSAAKVPFTFVAPLTAGTTYEAQVTNGDSSFVVDSFGTEGEIFWNVVQ